MALTPPSTLSPSKVATFTKCALAFRYSAIDKIPEAPSEAATKGTLVHGALERLMQLEPEERTTSAASACLEQAIEAIRNDDEFRGLGLDAAGEAAFFQDADKLIGNYFEMEDPCRVRPIGIEVMLEVPRDGYRIRGIIDRLELDDDGGLIVSDYKTGRSPGPRFAHGRMDGVKIYAAMVSELLGVVPSKIRLLYLRDRTIVEDTPSERALASTSAKVQAVWDAVERSCSTGNFLPKPSRLCDWCSFKPRCPAHAGNRHDR